MSKRLDDTADKIVHRLLTVSVTDEAGIVPARQRARQLARLLGFGQHDQIRIATATSEIVRNAVQYAGGCRVEFSIESEDEAQSLLEVSVRDRGTGIEEVQKVLDGSYRSKTGMGLGIAGTRRLMDRFSLVSQPASGTAVTFGKFLPAGSPRLDGPSVARIGEQLAAETPHNLNEELRQQSRELMAAVEALQGRESELVRRQAESERLNLELEETNRGVVALYAELDERASALSEANDIKSRFLSHMGHEFRTPLTSILALSELLIRRVDGDLTEEQEKQILFMRSSARELIDMVNDLLDTAKVESGKVEVRTGPVAVSQLFSALRGTMRPLMNSESVNLIFDDAPQDLMIYTDEAKLGQILRNLVSNAMKFTDRGEIRVSVKLDEEHVIFSVADTGIGIAQQDQERIFREFAQIDGPVQRKVKGTGLGLPLSRKLAELLGGTLTVESYIDLGSTFQLRVPLTRDGVSAAAEQDGLRGHGAVKTAEALALEEEYPGSILVIDDEEVARYLVRQLFRGTRYFITEAPGGIEGLERARFDRPKLVLLDLIMSDQSGFDVLDELKSDPATRDIPVVIHTSRNLSAEDLLRLNGQCAAVLPKQAGNRQAALEVMRKLLGEPYLFAGCKDVT